MNNSALLNLELLYAADYMGDLPKVQSILDNGLTPEVANFWGKKAATFAIAHGDTKMMKLFLDRGFYSKDEDACTRRNEIEELFGMCIACDKLNGYTYSIEHSLKMFPLRNFFWLT